ncbi:hypothetical protein J2Z47_006164 [Cohnella thailandensis]|nr:hypothetical protein [Cohnella thailandensis]
MPLEVPLHGFSVHFPLLSPVSRAVARFFRAFPPSQPRFASRYTVFPYISPSSASFPPPLYGFSVYLPLLSPVSGSVTRFFRTSPPPQPHFRRRCTVFPYISSSSAPFRAPLHGFSVHLLLLSPVSRAVTRFFRVSPHPQPHFHRRCTVFPCISRYSVPFRAPLNGFSVYLPCRILFT